ncbi:hypothetical protein [Streptomyces sp. NPDC003077]|uniref:hypothetical protein n=1 Tax=Streptomyces sp. NPDC003077 TaxID=3154443 RepID=UPI0033A32E8E
MTAFLAVIFGLLFAILGLLVDWPVWKWPLLAAAWLTVSLLTAKVLARGRQPRAPYLPPEEDLPIPPPVRLERRVTGVTLPSAVPDYDFSFSAVVRWAPIEVPPGSTTHIDPGALAVHAVLERAREITATWDPGRSDLVQHRLGGELGSMLLDSTGRLLAMADQVTVTLSEGDATRLAKLSAVRKDEDVWEHERKYELNKRAYLGGDVLKDTGSAVVWWLAKNDNQVKGAVDNIGVLAQLSAAANNADVAEPFRHLAPGAHPRESLYEEGGPSPAPPWQPDHEDSFTEHVGNLIRTAGFAADDPESAVMARGIADALTSVGRVEEAEGVRARFDAPAPPAGEEREDDEGRPFSDSSEEDHGFPGPSEAA